LPGWRAEIIGADGFSPHTPDSGFIRALRPPAQAARVTLRGYQPHSAVLAAMARAAIVVVPSRWQEPFGMTALEAMACGAALICTAQGGLAEVAGDACIQIPPENASELAEAMLRLAADGALRSALSEAGRRRASLCFSADTAMAKLDDMRDTIMAKAARD
jgi:glycosyltransferase involved in cell wall biosynthesis